jgi:cytochrome c biogenesis protein CcdA
MLLVFLTAFILGAAHAVAPDHLAAVGVFVSRARTPREALRHGARWGLGHALTLTVAGLAVLFVASAWPQALSLRAEWLVGVVLLGLGARTIWQAWRGEMAVADAEPDSPTPPTPRGERHRHPLLGIGMLHGLAGSGAMAVIVPTSAGRRPFDAALWMGLFGAGTIVAMAVIAGAVGWSLQRSAQRSAGLLRTAVTLAGIMSVVVGAFWLVNATA